ncbi:MAG: rhamnulokinase family protein [Acutalibacteraceae bacterium]|nr:rhamnulokinase family protein [Acutalibacteraceae bacterium]
MQYYLAIDIGASSGRHILGSVQDGKLVLEEIYRFENGFENDNSSLVWNTEKLFNEVREGIKKCGEAGKIPQTVAIDTWGVDYVLLDKNKKEILPAFCYRDSRTESVIPLAEEKLSFKDMYFKTGIQKEKFNTVYQLYADKLSGKLDNAEYFLMMPAYLSFKLTGVIKNEYTNATTGSLVNAQTHNWDTDIITALDLPKRLFGELALPSSEIGSFTKGIKDYVGFDSTVVFAPSHDTASAVAACPMGESDLYISSGTWSLIGTEINTAVISEDSFKANFTNEGGIEYRYRFLKNYMGMWLLQNIRKNINKSLTYDEMMYKAQACENFEYLDVNNENFVAPENMIDAIKNYFGKPDMSLDEVLASVYHSLARTYKYATEEIEKLTGKTINAIHIVGGGCQDKYLNRLTCEYTKKPVTAGPVEATAVGNLIAQLLYNKVCKDLNEARQLVKKSFDILEV